MVQLLSPRLHAEAPNVTALSPAGLQRGTDATITVVGKVGTRPVEVWTSHPGLTATVPEKGETITLQAAADVPAGVHFLRLHNAEGASTLRPFLVGVLPEVVEKEPNESRWQAATVDATGTVANGVLGKSGDVDCWQVALTKGQTLVAAVVAHEDLGSPMDAVLQVVSARGFVLDQDDDTRGNDPRLVFTAPADGTYTVRLFAFPAAPNSTIGFAGGSDYVYRLTLTTGPYIDHREPLAPGDAPADPVGWNLTDAAPDSPSDDVPARPTPYLKLSEGRAAERLTPPVAVTGRIAVADEVDTFAFRATKGERLSLAVESRELGFPLDAVLEVTDDAGKSLKRVDDPKRNEFDPRIDFDPPADGTYHVRVSDIYGTFGVRHAYRLVIAPPTSDFDLTLTPDVLAIEAGGTQTLEVTITRRHGFAEPIDITATDLPEGVTVKAATSAAKGDTSTKVTLEFTATKTATGGPIRITGRAGERLHTATFAIGTTRRRHDALWLTVRPSKEK